MRKSRLEELRKQKATVYTVFDGDKKATALVLDENCNDNNVLAIAYLSLSNLWETKELAEWHNKTYVERTERFEPPMWEEIEKVYHFYFYVKSIPYAFHVDKNLQLIEFSRDYLHSISIYKGELATKENYIKACEIVRDLFKGEK